MSAPPLTLSNRQILKLLDGARALSGVSSKANEIRRFDFPGSLVWDIAKDESILEDAENVLQKAKKALAAKHKIVENMKVTDENAAQISAFVTEYEELLDRTQELHGLIPLKLAELQKGGVDIPSVLKNLMPLIKE